MQELILYSTLGCHLCELAQDEITPCIEGTHWCVKEVDIADDEQLLKQYGTSIPVLYSPVSREALFWPFDRTAVAHFIEAECS